jgi:hypothetical protein
MFLFVFCFDLICFCFFVLLFSLQQLKKKKKKINFGSTERRVAGVAARVTSVAADHSSLDRRFVALDEEHRATLVRQGLLEERMVAMAAERERDRALMAGLVTEVERLRRAVTRSGERRASSEEVSEQPRAALTNARGGSGGRPAPYVNNTRKSSLASSGTVGGANNVNAVPNAIPPRSHKRVSISAGLGNGEFCDDGDGMALGWVTPPAP